MRGGVSHHNSSVRFSRPLVVRGGLVRTFGGLASFLALTFLCWGTYVLANAVANPIEAQPAAVLAGAFNVSLGAILFFYLIKPRRRARTAALQRSRGSIAHTKQLVFSNAPFLVSDKGPRRDLLYQRLYVDPSRIQPRSRV
jgi:hypothetical protein